MSAAHDITPTPYHEVEGVNWSVLREMRKSPLHFRWALDHQRPDSDTFRRGRLVHTLSLEPERLAFEYVVWDLAAAEAMARALEPPAKGKPPAITASRRGKVWEAFEAANTHRTIVTPKMLDLAQAMASRVRDAWSPDAQREVTLTWTDPTTGLKCKGRLDSMAPDRVTELKTCRDAGASAMSRQMMSLDYAHQLAHYRMGLRALTRVEPACRIVAVEAAAPHGVSVFDIDEEALISAEVEVTNLLKKVAECRASGVWPDRYDAPQPLSFPAWAQANEDNDITEIGLEWAADDAEENEES